MLPGIALLVATFALFYRACAEEPELVQALKPSKLERPIAILPLQSDGRSALFRTQVLVKPAGFPPSNESFNTALIAESSSRTQADGNGVDLSKAYQQLRSSPPADAVSLALAFRQAQDHQVPEDRFFYGFRSMPVECPCVKPLAVKEVTPEENIYALNGQILELGPLAAQQENLSAEAVEELLDSLVSEEAPRFQAVQRPSLSELGYSPVSADSRNYLQLALPQTVPSGAPVECHEAFQAGAVEYRPVKEKIFRHLHSKPRKSKHGQAGTLSMLGNVA